MEERRENKMGEIIRANASEVYPYQTYARFDSLMKLLPIFNEGREDELFPCIVGRFPQGLITIDGHQRLTLADLFGKKLSLYIMDNEGDLIQRALFPDLDLNNLWHANIIAAFTYENAAIQARKIQESNCPYTFAQHRRENGIDDLESLERMIRQYCPNQGAAA